MWSLALGSIQRSKGHPFVLWCSVAPAVTSMEALSQTDCTSWLQQVYQDHMIKWNNAAVVLFTCIQNQFSPHIGRKFNFNCFSGCFCDKDWLHTHYFLDLFEWVVLNNEGKLIWLSVKSINEGTMSSCPSVSFSLLAVIRGIQIYSTRNVQLWWTDNHCLYTPGCLGFEGWIQKCLRLPGHCESEEESLTSVLSVASLTSLSSLLSPPLSLSLSRSWSPDPDGLWPEGTSWPDARVPGFLSCGIAQ